MKSLKQIYNEDKLNDEFLDMLEMKNGLSLYRPLKMDNKLNYYYYHQQLNYIPNHNSCLENYTEYHELKVPAKLLAEKQKFGYKIEVEHWLIDLSISNRQ